MVAARIVYVAAEVGFWLPRSPDPCASNFWLLPAQAVWMTLEALNYVLLEFRDAEGFLDSETVRTRHGNIVKNEWKPRLKQRWAEMGICMIIKLPEERLGAGIW